MRAHCLCVLYAWVQVVSLYSCLQYERDGMGRLWYLMVCTCVCYLYVWHLRGMAEHEWYICACLCLWYLRVSVYVCWVILCEWCLYVYKCGLRTCVCLVGMYLWLVSQYVSAFLLACLCVYVCDMYLYVCMLVTCICMCVSSVSVWMSARTCVCVSVWMCTMCACVIVCDICGCVCPQVRVCICACACEYLYHHVYSVCVYLCIGVLSMCVWCLVCVRICSVCTPMSGCGSMCAHMKLCMNASIFLCRCIDTLLWKLLRHTCDVSDCACVCGVCSGIFGRDCWKYKFVSLRASMSVDLSGWLSVYICVCYFVFCVYLCLCNSVRQTVYMNVSAWGCVYVWLPAKNMYGCLRVCVCLCVWGVCSRGCWSVSLCVMMFVGECVCA